MKTVFLQHDSQAWPINNIFCIGRNYAAHIAELNHRPNERPLVFLKPTSALHGEDTPITLPAFSTNVHYETELLVLIGTGGKNIKPEEALNHVAGYGIGLDLTARDLQEEAQMKGLPWTLAKGFDGSACVSRFIAASNLPNVMECSFTMKLNGELRQHGEVTRMLFNLPTLISYLSQAFTLNTGDLIFTGTPQGVGPLHNGDVLELELANQLSARFSVAR